MTMTPDVNVQVIDLKTTNQSEVVTENEDGSYTIFLNARFTQERRAEAYEHAMRHIMNDDFKEPDVQKIENDAHGIVKDVTVPTEAINQIISQSNKIKYPRRRKRRKNRKKERYVQDRVAFLSENCDMFAIAEHNYLYGKDL